MPEKRREFPKGVNRFGFGKEWVWVAVLMGEEGLWVDGRGGPVGCHFSIERMRNDGNLCGVSIEEERL